METPLPFSPTQGPTVADLLHAYETDYLPHLATSTQTVYRRVYKRLCAHVGQLRVRDLQPAEAQRILHGLSVLGTIQVNEKGYYRARPRREEQQPMMTRYVLSQVPFPLNEIPPTDTTLDTVDFRTITHALLEQTHGLAHVLAIVSHDENVVDEDLSQGLDVLAGYLESALAVFERWEQDAMPAREIRKAQRQADIEARLTNAVEPLPELLTLLPSLSRDTQRCLLRLLLAFMPQEEEHPESTANPGEMAHTEEPTNADPAFLQE